MCIAHDSARAPVWGTLSGSKRWERSSSALPMEPGAGFKPPDFLSSAACGILGIAIYKLIKQKIVFHSSACASLAGRLFRAHKLHSLYLMK